MYMGNIATGTFVHNIEIIPKKGGQMVRSAGAGAQVMAHDDGFTSLKASIWRNSQSAIKLFCNNWRSW